MTTRNEAHSAINALIHKMRDMGTAREGHTLTWVCPPAGYWLVWQDDTTGGQAYIVHLGKGPTKARETAWDMLATLDTITRYRDEVTA